MDRKKKNTTTARGVALYFLLCAKTQSTPPKMASIKKDQIHSEGVIGIFDLEWHFLTLVMGDM